VPNLISQLERRVERLTRPQGGAAPDAVTWTPFPGPQSAALDSPADELFYGGAAGGGKTGLLVGLSLTQHHRSLLLRRESTHLKEIGDQLREAAGSGGWRGLGAYGGTLRYRGRVIELAGCKDESDKEDYKGRPHDLIGFDEVADFLETQYTFVIGWNRTTVAGQRCRVVATGNPPTRGTGEWVIRRWAPWIDPTGGKRSKPGELRWYSTIDGREEEFPDGTPFRWKSYTIAPLSRTFIPAALADNPALLKTNYASKLAALPDALRRAYLEGDFGVSLQDDPWQVIPTAWIKAAQARWVPNGAEDSPRTAAGFDIAYGGSDRTVFVDRHANWFAMPATWSGAETDSGEKAAALAAQKMGGSRAPLNIDVIGYGAAAFEFCKKQKLNVVPVNFGSSANGLSDRRNVLAFLNVRAYAYWQLRDALDPDLGGNLALPPDPDLLAELTAARFELVGGKIKLEPKEDITERLGRSPDKADAVVLANMEPSGIGFFFKVL
jgi:hypothetical protein